MEGNQYPGVVDKYSEWEYGQTIGCVLPLSERTLSARK